MVKYADKDSLIAEIEKTAGLFITEFGDITESDKDKRLEEVDRNRYCDESLSQLR
jgi:hypothetical protein